MTTDHQVGGSSPSVRTNFLPVSISAGIVVFIAITPFSGVGETCTLTLHPAIPRWKSSYRLGNLTLHLLNALPMIDGDSNGWCCGFSINCIYRCRKHPDDVRDLQDPFVCWIIDDTLCLRHHLLAQSVPLLRPINCDDYRDSFQ